MRNMEAQRCFVAVCTHLDFESGEGRIKIFKKIWNTSFPFLFSVFKHCSNSQIVKRYLFFLFSHMVFTTSMLFFPPQNKDAIIT